MIIQTFQHSAVTRHLLLAALTVGFAASGIAASPLYTAKVFAKGSAVPASNPLGVTYDGTDIWVSYVNTAATDGSSGSSTVVEYDTSANVLNTYVVAGYVEGLRFDSKSGAIWAMQNPGGNPLVTTIKPGAGISTGSPFAFAVEPPTRGYANVDFASGIYLSMPSPVNPTDPTIQQILSSTSPFPVGTILEMNATGTNIATGATDQPTLQNDPHCLRGTPTKGQIVMSSAADGQLIFISNVGSQTTQSVSFLNVVNATGANVAGLNDVIYNNATSGIFYVADVAGNEIVAITATGITANSLYATIGSLNAFAEVDPTKGTVLPILTNLPKPAAMIFVGK